MRFENLPPEDSFEKHDSVIEELEELIKSDMFRTQYTEIFSTYLSNEEAVSLQNEIKSRVALYINTKLSKEQKMMMGKSGENIPVYVKTTFVLPEIELESKDRVEKRALEAKKELEALEQDFEENKNNPVLLDALESWGRSPNLYGDRGKNDVGYNAGVVHFFQYRADKVKSGRLKNYPMTIDAFISMTDYLKTLLEHTDSGNIEYMRKLKDSEGQEQVFILDTKGWMLVGFKKKDEKMKILSYFPADKKKIDKAAQEYLEPKTGEGVEEKRRFNALKGDVEEIKV